MVCCDRTRPAGTSGPTACVGAGAAPGDEAVADTARKWWPMGKWGDAGESSAAGEQQRQSGDGSPGLGHGCAAVQVPISAERARLAAELAANDQLVPRGYR